jgi:hypothetical protein
LFETPGFNDLLRIRLSGNKKVEIMKKYEQILFGPSNSKSDSTQVFGS